MPATDDRWDVVVVGLRDPSHAAARMAVAELAHYASLPPQDVERMLEDGEVLVLENLDRAEAERAAYELAELGTLVDLRLTMNESGVFPVFKPDAERQIGVAVGGLIDDSATPPTVGAAVGLPQLEPDLEAPQQPRGRPRVATPSPPRADDSGSGKRPRVATPSPPRADDSGSGKRPRVATPSPPRADDSGSGKRPPATSPAHPKPETAPDVESLLGDIGPATPAAPKLPQRLQRATATAQAGPTHVEVDFAAAGIVPPPKRGPAVGPAPATAAPMADRSASDMPRRTRAGHTGGTGASASGRAHQDGGALEVLRNDGIAALLVGLAVALALSLILALQLQRSGVRDRLPPLEEELAASLADPADVATGKRRDPGVVESEIEEALGDLQQKFLLWWLVPGIGVGLLLSRFSAR